MDYRSVDCYNKSIDIGAELGRGVVWYIKGEAFNALGRTTKAFAKAKGWGIGLISALRSTCKL